MDTSTVIFQTYAIAILIMVIAIPTIMMLFTLSIVKKTARRAFRFKSTKKKK